MKPEDRQIQYFESKQGLLYGRRGITCGQLQNIFYAADSTTSRKLRLDRLRNFAVVLMIHDIDEKEKAASFD